MCITVRRLIVLCQVCVYFGSPLSDNIEQKITSLGHGNSRLRECFLIELKWSKVPVADQIQWPIRSSGRPAPNVYPMGKNLKVVGHWSKLQICSNGQPPLKKKKKLHGARGDLKKFQLL